ncbi:hypothetical protein [Flavobacterium wongokense]|uniref:hypothetical protein n=1 Tax=Flavobacterium wongokense TaxID=2910674 RepID=UPI001F3FADCB|nr:hypothetical protein [Flavobacterium sp. WG47]MCF6133456.1 hypothetical protein [Flavobacterium sp. WG47]
MKASVQYDDFVGTAAADISDHTNLKKFLEAKNVDTERYQAIGVSFYCGYSRFFSASVICIDNEQSTAENKYIVKMGFDIDKDEFFNLFKRFNVIISQKHGGYENLEIDEEIMFGEDETEE